jgi:hypothetical protein
MVKSILKEYTKDNVISQEVILDPELSYKIKPRGIVFKADYKDLDKIKGSIKTQFPNVKIVYVYSWTC